MKKIKCIKVVCLPYRAIKIVISKTVNYIKYFCSLHYISVNKKRIREKIKNKEMLNVVFIIQYIPGWNKLEPIYTKMKQDNRFNPIIVCVPLNIQKHKLMDDNGNDTYRYFVDHGYDAIDSLQVNNTWYDLCQLNPDYVFHSRPYNNFMPEEYTSGKIVKYALICNVIYGPCMTRNGLRVTLNMDYFKDTYMYYAFEKSEKSFYENKYKLGIKRNVQKCLPFGSIGMEQMLEVKTAKRKSEFEHIVLWTPRWSTDIHIGGSNFFNYKDVMIKLAKENQDVLFIFRPHPLMFSNFIKTGEMSQDEVESFMKYCEKEKNILLDESKEYSDTLWNSDFLITDASGIVMEYLVTEKPIIYCHTKALFDYVEYAKELVKSCYEVNNKEDLLLYFSNLIKNNDTKRKQRLACINRYFDDVTDASTNILNSLGQCDL